MISSISESHVGSGCAESDAAATPPCPDAGQRPLLTLRNATLRRNAPQGLLCQREAGGDATLSDGTIQCQSWQWQRQLWHCHWHWQCCMIS